MRDRIRTSPRSAAFSLVLVGVAVVGVGIMYFLSRSTEGAGGATEQDMLVAPRDGATIGSVRTRFHWQRNAQSTAYSFFLYEVNRTLVWSALVRDTSLVIPSSVKLERGRTYLWRVEAIMPDETTIRSELHAFTLSQ
ncbi:MAG: hypothetical protein HW412_2489 [Bacteroidetes bacterium]|nr:hypothetical protein [Bacteroidota bacterium]